MKASCQSFLRALLGLAIYLGAAILWFGLPVLDDFSHTYIGMPGSADPSAYMWFLAWWPYALANRLNPFVTQLVFAPQGFNITWSPCVPLPALLMVPITRTWGPVASWNVLMLLAPALAAWCTFILCYHVCRSFLPALVGGYLFGFSPYMLGHLLGHLSLVLIFPVPLAVLLVILRVEKRVSRANFVVLFATVALVQFLCCNEVLATAVLFGAIVIVIAMFTMGAAVRSGLWEVSALASLGLALAAIALIPFLYYALFDDFPRGAIFPPDVFSSDLLAFLVPPPILLIAVPGPINSFAMQLPKIYAEDTAYIGIPMLWLVLDYSLTDRANPAIRTMILALLATAVASLGPVLHIAGRESIGLPAALLAHLPLIDKALPGRFMAFAFLDLALLIALYLSTPPHGMRKSILAILCIGSLIPNLGGRWWISKADIPSFFAHGSFRRYLRKDEITLILPYGRHDRNSMLWQTQTGMYYRMVGGSLGRTTAEFWGWPAGRALYNGEPSFDFAAQLKFFLGAHHVETIIVAGKARERWPAWLGSLHLTGSSVDDVILYRVPREVRDRYSAMTAEEAAKSEITGAFTAMVMAADAYWARGLPLDRLTPWEAARLNLLTLPPTTTGADPKNPKVWQDLWLGQDGEAMVGIGIFGDYADLRRVIDRYGRAAKEVFFPYPEMFRASISADTRGWLLMRFDRQGLDLAVMLAASPGKP